MKLSRCFQTFDEFQRCYGQIFDSSYSVISDAEVEHIQKNFEELRKNISEHIGPLRFESKVHDSIISSIEMVVSEVRRCDKAIEDCMIESGLPASKLEKIFNRQDEVFIDELCKAKQFDRPYFDKIRVKYIKARDNLNTIQIQCRATPPGTDRIIEDYSYRPGKSTAGKTGIGRG